MITLLMVLFIVLFAIGQTDLAKFQELKTGLANTYGGKGGTPVLVGGSGALAGSPALVSGVPPLVSGVIDQKTTAGLASAATALQEKNQQQAEVQVERRTLTTAQAEIQQALDARGLGGNATFEITGRGLVVTIVTDQVVYDTDSAVLRPGGQEILAAIAPAIRTLPNDIAIEGHTDDLPVTGGPYPTNWELSTARATSVLHFLVDTLHVDATRLSASGYGDERPLVPNVSDANRAKNRRVAIVVLSDISLNQGAPS